MKKLFLLLAACAVVSCSKDAEAPVSGALAPVRIDPTITRATEVDFEAGDAVGLTIVTSEGTHASNAEMVYADGTFVSKTGLLWYDDLGMTSTLKAYYPYAETAPAQFSVAADQTAGGYGASDLMMASKEGVVPSANAIGMTFKHKMTKLVIEVENEYGLKVTGVEISNSIGTADVDIDAQTVAVKEGAETLKIRAKEVTAGAKYVAILVPQTVALRVDVACENNGKTEIHTQSLTASALQSGAQYTMHITVLPSEVRVSLSGDIEEWTNGGNLDGEDVVLFEEFDDHFVYYGETYKIVTLADGNTWMAENLRYVPDGKTPSADPSVESGIWYPQQVVETDGTYVAQVSTDAAYVARVGYYYDFCTAVGIAEITEENSTTFEGVQGICPKGWHIPTVGELTALVAAYKSADGKTYWSDLDKDGFNTTLIQLRSRNTSATSGAYSSTLNAQSHEFAGGWLMSSTANTANNNNYKVNATTGAVTSQNKALMFLNTYIANTGVTNSSMTVSNASNFAGIPVRCVKNR